MMQSGEREGTDQSNEDSFGAMEFGDQPLEYPVPTPPSRVWSFEERSARALESRGIAKLVVTGINGKGLSVEAFSRVNRRLDKDAYPETLGVDPICPAWEKARAELKKDFGVIDAPGWNGLIFARRQAVIDRGVSTEAEVVPVAPKTRAVKPLFVPAITPPVVTQHFQQQSMF
jgi:hypothetical protein